MQTFKGNIVELAKANTDFRRVIFTGEHTQLVLMSLLPGEEIGEETHDVDQALIFVEGLGKTVLNHIESPVKTGDCVVVPAGTLHNFVNTGDATMKLYTFYSPPEHKDGTIRHTKKEATEIPE